MFNCGRLEKIMNPEDGGSKVLRNVGIPQHDDFSPPWKP
jgi:hypothetical protein